MLLYPSISHRILVRLRETVSGYDFQTGQEARLSKLLPPQQLPLPAPNRSEKAPNRLDVPYDNVGTEMTKPSRTFVGNCVLLTFKYFVFCIAN